MNEHPITPSPELIRHWSISELPNTHDTSMQNLAVAAARWGADQELEACIFWLIREGWFGSDGIALQKLRAARRPKPATLKQQALEQLHGIEACFHVSADTIRHALEALPDDLEGAF